MKFFHLSDLHIGKTVNRFSMLEEQENVFDQIIAYIRKEKPDAVIIAGDVYDRAIPGVEAVRIFDDFLTNLAREDIAVMLIAGNHDSPERMDYASRLLSEKKLFLCGSFNGKIQKHMLADKYGEVNFWLLPFIKPIAVRNYFADLSIESYDDAVRVILSEANIDYSQRNILVSHQFYTKSGITALRSDSEMDMVGGMDAVDAGLIENFDYAALGHLHGKQPVGAKHIQYAGSPVKYSLSEWRHEKSINSVILNEKGDLNIESLSLKPIHDMREIKGNMEALLSDEVASLRDKNDYLKVILTDEEEIIDPMGKLRSVYPNIMHLDLEKPRKNNSSAEINHDLEAARELSPLELFDNFFNMQLNKQLSAEQKKIAREILETEDSDLGLLN